MCEQNELSVWQYSPVCMVKIQIKLFYFIKHNEHNEAALGIAILSC